MNAARSNPLAHFPQNAPRRVISLVPSWSGSLYDLGLGSVLAGVSDYCPQPPAGAPLPALGGPKNPRLADLLALRPDLVIANQEENDRASIEAIEAAGLPVWLTFPLTVRAMLDDLYTAASLFRSEIALAMVQELERSAEWAELTAANQAPRRVFCPVWQEQDPQTGLAWWMTFNAQTYSSDVLRICGGENVFAARDRRYPLSADLGLTPPEDPAGRDTRYPRVTAPEIIAAQPELILLPNEPYAYQPHHATALSATFAATPAAQAGRIFTADGAWLHWPGTRLAQALAELPGLLDA